MSAALPIEPIKVWAIRVKGTDRYLPFNKRYSKGWSHDEPVSRREKRPRFFDTAYAAGCAMRAWKAGVWKVHRSSSNLDGDVDIELRIHPKETRKHVPLEVVEFHCIEQFPYEDISDVLSKNVQRAMMEINCMREEIIRAFLAKTGLQPDQCEMVQEGYSWFVRQRRE